MSLQMAFCNEGMAFFLLITVEGVKLAKYHLYL